ncbi:MAG: GNAT family N-acetyltransferase [Pseudomonadota bacterium]
MIIDIVKVDYLNKNHAKDFLYLLNSYAEDPMGGRTSLNQYTKDNLVKELAKLPYAFSFLTYVDGKPAALINCFEAFSTFNCKPLINIHDVIVLKSYRGIGISQKMLLEVEKVAKIKGCCKLTLEVLYNNYPARSSYKKFGFSDYELDPDMGSALFLQKLLFENKVSKIVE